MMKYKEQGIESIHRSSDSPFHTAIQYRLNRKSLDSLIFDGILCTNLATGMAVGLAYFGLDLKSILIYIALAYSLIIASSLSQLVFLNSSVTGRNVHWFNCLMEDAAIWLALPVNAFSGSASPTLVTLGFVFSFIFILASVTSRAYIDFVISKAIFLIVSVCFVFLWGDADSRSPFVIFPLLVSFVMLFSVGYWHYLRQVKMLHLTMNENLLKEELEQRNLQLLNEHRLRDRIIRQIGHDLRQPVNSIALALFNFRTAHQHDTQNEHVQLALRALDDVNCQIEDIVQISSYKKEGAIEVSIERCHVGDVLAALKREYTLVAEEANCSLTVVPSSVEIETDPIILGRVLRNFISNAIKHAKGAKVLLGVRRRGETIEIQVCDDGPGIKPELLEKLFQEFVQGEGKDSGFGLGLNIAMTLAAAIDGKVSVNSTVGRGSKFSLTLRTSRSQS